MARMEAATLARLLGEWADPEVGLGESLTVALNDLVDVGLVAPGTTLPPQRAMAAALGISRGTVASALASLEGTGRVIATQGSGTRVRAGRGRAQHLGEGRFFSFTDAPAEVIDLSTGALPASEVARRTLARAHLDLDPYLDTDGYFPAGIPVLRQALAARLSADGIPTTPRQLLITAGAQQATSLTIRHLVEAGDLAVVEEPTYRGVLETLRSTGVRTEAIPFTEDGLDADLLAHSLRRRPRLVYCQTSIHNPTGRSSSQPRRRRIAEVVNRAGLAIIEDCCSHDLTATGVPAPTLAGLVEPGLLLSVGTASKLFWGGLRIGWVRADPSRIRALVELRKASDLATSIIDQLIAVNLLGATDEARAERLAQFRRGVATTTAVLQERRPAWSAQRVDGGTGLWVDTGEDALALAEVAKRAGVKLAPGPSFSAHEGQRTMLRVPWWHPRELLAEALGRLDTTGSPG